MLATLTTHSFKAQAYARIIQFLALPIFYHPMARCGDVTSHTYCTYCLHIVGNLSASCNLSAARLHLITLSTTCVLYHYTLISMLSECYLHIFPCCHCYQWSLASGPRRESVRKRGCRFARWLQAQQRRIVVRRSLPVLHIYWSVGCEESLFAVPRMVWSVQFRTQALWQGNRPGITTNASLCEVVPLITLILRINSHCCTYQHRPITNNDTRIWCVWHKILNHNVESSR